MLNCIKEEATRANKNCNIYTLIPGGKEGDDEGGRGIGWERKK